MPCFDHAADAFGDPFALDKLPLPRPAAGYAVQMLGSDRLLDRRSGAFLPVRSPALAGLFDTFAAARQAAEAWVDGHCRTPAEHRLAIVPAAFDDVLERHVLIYGVLEEHP
ncbi:MAG: hypothetical protein LBE81_09105 [Azonexus sp.]|jgi:hypothetical protein|uniref:hypothetical protein n=1 Tax=Azonexus sp. TaxID=1872668 RepID=UPI002837C55D|nr:hypothetical protein [Azonexus sp.]MDR0776779.1 hypothetical protein [Azonexus sp.]